ncbi:MAG: NAD(P)H-dependent oxidoreductase subunit E [Tepidiformaceae bacterium]
MHAEPSVQELRELLAEFQPGKGHVLPALHKVQHHYGYISRPAIEAVARQLNTTAAMIYGAVSFYSDFRTVPPPETEIAWCSGPACRLEGGDRVRELIEHVLDMPLGHQSEDGKYGFIIGQCNGTCTEAPQVWLNGKVVGRLTPSATLRLARSVKENA